MRKSTRRTSTPIVDKLEDRKLMAVSNLTIGKNNVINLFGSDGFRLNSNRVTVQFSAPVTIADASKIQLRGYATNPLSGRQKLTVINITSAAIDSTDANRLVLTTDVAVRKGGRMYFYTGALKDASNNDVVREPADPAYTLTKGLTKPRYTLARRAFSPFDFTFYDRPLYNASPDAPDVTTAPVAADVRNALDAFMQLKVNSGRITAAKKTEAMALYDNATNTQIVPDANIRAGISALIGTAAEPAIQHYYNGLNPSGKAPSVVTYSGTLLGDQTLIAETQILSNGRLRIIFNPRYRGESFQVLSATLAHEAMHVDASDPINEEVVANAVQTMIWGEQVGVQPSIARQGTTLVTANNARLLSLLNSGDRQFPRVGLLNAPLKNGTSVLPGANAPYGTQPITSFYDEVNREYSSRGFAGGDSTLGEVGRRIFGNITGNLSTVTPSSNGFSFALIQQLDAFQGTIGDQVAINLAGALKLNVS